MNMPTKDPGLWAMICQWLFQHQPPFNGLFLAIAIAWLRVTYSGGSQRQRLLESLLCGAISLSLMSAMEWFGIPASASGFIGGSVGFLGVEKMRRLADIVCAKRVGKIGGDDGQNQ